MGLGELIDRSRSAIVDVAEGVRDGFIELAHTENPEAFIGNLLGLDGPAIEGVHFDLVGFIPDEMEEYLPEVESYVELGKMTRWLHMMGVNKDWSFDLDFRKLMFWLGVIMVLILVAVLTNPTEASFRTHLTELSFRRHLAVIRSNDDHPAEASTPSLPSTTSPSITTGNNANLNTPHNDDKPDKSPPTITLGTSTPILGNETPPIAPFRFSNHVAISLRTPMLFFRSLFVLSVALTSPIGPPAFLSDPPHAHAKKGAVAREKMVLYIGCLGYWTQIGVIPAKMEWAYRALMAEPKEKGRKKISAERSGVLELRAMPGKDEVVSVGSSTKAIPLNPSKSGKTIRRMGSTNDLHENPILPLHSLPTIPLPAKPESRRPSLIDLLPPSSTSTELADTPTLVALKAELSKSQDTLLDLKNQLLSHEQTVSDAHASLQSTLDELRNKRKEDDVERQELKGRTRNFEEQKRQAESARKEAEKRLKAAEVGRDGLLAKIEGSKKEMVDIRAQIVSSERVVRTLSQEKDKYLQGMKEAIEERKVELERLEEEMSHVEAEQEELGGKVREAEERLKATQESVEAAKKIGPEEEMMMMAAAYEAAAQEGYMYGQGQGQGLQGTRDGGVQHSQGHTPAPHPGGHDTHSANWASQAAAYMAEAGMPLLDQSYTARTTSATHPRPTQGDTKRLTDLTGFEDFGPGSHSHSHANIGNGDGFNQILGNAANRLQYPSTPPAEDYSSESDMYGFAPGSPNGGISTSFSANLLPQGLFRSLLGGDMTPIDDEAGSTLSEALNFDPPPIDLQSASPDAISLDMDLGGEVHGNGQAAGSDSEDETEDIWRSPMLEHNHPVEPADKALVSPVSTTTPANRSKRFSFSRLLPPNATPPSSNSATAPSSLLSGLPPVSRRWFSGTNSASAENLHAFPLFQANGSSDSLGNNHTGSLGLGGDSPFAPSETEKKQLAQKWGPLSKYRWAAPVGGDASAGGGGASGAARSSSVDLGSPSTHARGTSAPNPSASPDMSGIHSSPGQSWMARHLHVNGSPATASHPTKSKSPLIPSSSGGGGSSGHRASSDLLADDELDYHSLIPTPISNLGSSADSKEDKKSFKFFSLRKSQGGGGIGTSPGSQ